MTTVKVNPPVLELNISGHTLLSKNGIKLSKARIERLLQEVVSSQPATCHLPPVTSLEISLLFCNDERIRKLNNDFRGRNKPTNVLSFPSHDDISRMINQPHIYLGDIALSLETNMREAAEEGKIPEYHVTHLLVHGALHLLGHDHETSTEAEEMEALEASILNKFNIPNPYCST